MRRGAASLRALFVALPLCACAAGPGVSSEPPLAAPAWPPSPSVPLVRWHATLPAPAQRVQQSTFRRVLSFLLGTDDGDAAQGFALARPFGIFAGDSSLWVADPDGRQVVRLPRQGGEPEQVTCAARPWKMPMAVGVREGAVFVADAGAHQLTRVTPQGCDALGAGGALDRPTGIAFAAGRVYTVDPPRHAVIGFGAGGREEVRFGVRGDGPGEVNFPCALAALPDGQLLVVDALNFRVSRYTPEGRHLGSFGEPGDGAGAFGRPKAITVGADGRIFVSDATHDVVIVFGPGGEFQLAFGGTGRGPGSLIMPAGLAVAGGRVWVADSLNARIEEYELLGEAR